MIFAGSKLGGLANSHEGLILVIPEKAEIQYFQGVKNIWTPAFTGVTTYYETI